MKSPKETAVPAPSAPEQSSDQPVLARRAIIKVAASSVPTILSLQSGAALARSSNLIRPAIDSKDALGRTLCLSEYSVSAVYPNGQIDLGPEGSGYVTAIVDREFYSEPNSASTPISEVEMCLEGKPGHFKSLGWQVRQPEKGYIVSMDALSSFDNIKMDEI